MNDNRASRHPNWFRMDPGGPHRKSGGLGADGYHYEFYCAKDGEAWPCAAERDQTRQRAR